MDWVIPKYIPLNDISKQPINYHWKDWDPYIMLEPASEETLDALAEISDRGVITFSIGCAEWVIYRLSPYFKDQRVWYYLEACWALVLGAPIAIPTDPVFDEWQGKILSPIGLSILTILNAWRMVENDRADAYAGFAERIPLWVLHDTQPFISWRDIVLQRLIRWHPYDENTAIEPLVPREILDPSIDLDGINQDALVKKELNRIGLENNPYISKI